MRKKDAADARRLYKWSLTLPFVVPVILLLVDLPMDLVGIEGGFVESLLGLLGYSAFVWLVPYTVFVSLISLHLREKSLRYHVVASVWAPVLFAVCLSLLAVVFAWGEPDMEDLAMVYGLATVVVGYAYSLLANGLYCLSRRLGWTSSVSA